MELLSMLSKPKNDRNLAGYLLYTASCVASEGSRPQQYKRHRFAFRATSLLKPQHWSEAAGRCFIQNQRFRSRGRDAVLIVGWTAG